MDFEEWAELYALDYEPLTTDSRRADCKAAWEAATKAEREACAKVCDTKANENADKWEGDEAKAASWMMLQCAAEIRKRSNASNEGPRAFCAVRSIKELGANRSE